MAILRSFLTLLLFQIIGTTLQTALHIPVPGAVLGMALLAAWLLLRRRTPDPALTATAKTLLSWFGLLFVPAGVGVITFLPLLRASWLPIAVALIGSTLLALVATGTLMQRLRSRA